ncbi:hypothetical protein L3Q82_023652 [Scortum barcoo]|uniref:Uncharacterized protein n=1 Tax=Scortum barcoo TaxID=214431 RepID=A0ACB8WWD9_9TELE|nr:hypothetical protein L3Q82_023652 [Scortum barcoo]
MLAGFNLSPVPQSPGAAGVFMVTDGGEYTFNFTAARAACLSLNVTMATMAQMERALWGGLETCKFGWIAEQIAVVPRVTSHTKCGKGKTGVVQWLANPDKKFGAFCFNASGTFYLLFMFLYWTVKYLIGNVDTKLDLLRHADSTEPNLDTSAAIDSHASASDEANNGDGADVFHSYSFSRDDAFE